MRKRSLGFFPTRSDTNWAEQPQKIVRGLKFWIEVVEGLYYPYSENKGADQLRGASLFWHMQKSGFLMTRFISNCKTNSGRYSTLPGRSSLSALSVHVG